ncbi:DUF4864 domain-containing protein [Alkalinema pantanalense CENA528]|uniref:DUF4864 domain-containing protein n=1 Tax=Alkalinema pantanalense TaxID=1620705 RepID=UPI003D6F39D2
MDSISEFDRRAIREVVELQLSAFQRDDAVCAFSLASPGIQAMFRNPTNFMNMVRQSYEPAYRPRSVIFEDVVVVQGNFTQPVLLLSPQGVPVRALYLMEHLADGRWVVNGCYLVAIEGPVV